MKDVKSVGIKQTKLKRFGVSKKGIMKTYTSVEKLAYNNAASYKSTVDDKVFNYTKKQVDDFITSSLLLPSSMKNKENFKSNELFNELDKKSEHKLEARIAMNYIISLPQEIDKLESFEAVKEYFQYIVNKKNNFIDISLHVKNEGKENANPHIHILEARRSINEDGKIGKSLHHRDVKNLIELDNINNIRKDLADIFNQLLKKNNVYNTEYTHLSNNEIIEKALEEGNIPLAMAKDYDPGTYKKENRDTKEKANYLKRNSKKTKEKRLNIKNKIAEKKKESEDYKQYKEYLEQELKKFENIEAEYNTAKELDEYINKSGQIFIEALDFIEVYEARQKDNKALTQELIKDFYTAMINEDVPFSSKKDIRDFLKEKAKDKDYFSFLNNEKFINEDKEFIASMLAHKIFEKPESYIDKAHYYIAKDIKEAEEERYNELQDLLDEAIEQNVLLELTEEEEQFLVNTENKREAEKFLYMKAVDELFELRNQLNITAEEMTREQIQQHINKMIDDEYLANENENVKLLSYIEKEAKKQELTNYISRKFVKICENKDEYIRKGEEFNQLRKLRQEQREIRREKKRIFENIEQLRQKQKERQEQLTQQRTRDYIDKQVATAANEVLQEFDEVARIVYKYSNNALQADFSNNDDEYNYTNEVREEINDNFSYLKKFN